MGEDDLADMVLALEHLAEAVREISRHMPPDSAGIVLKAYTGASTCLQNIAYRQETQLRTLSKPE